MTAVDQEWRRLAACRNAEDPDAVFYPADSGPPDAGLSAGTRAAYREARDVCRKCEVRRECLEDELRFPPSHQYGMRGGLTAKQRIAILRRRNGTTDEATACGAKRHGTATAYKKHGCRCPDAREDMRVRRRSYANRTPRRPLLGYDPQAVERALSGDRRVVLTVREMREAVRRLLDLGLTGGQVAIRLGVSQRTVSRHRSALRRELQPCGTRAAYVRHLAHGEEPCKACAKAMEDERGAA